MNKKISIIIPVKNGECYLKEAIESALCQDYSDKELIVIDDGSTDATSQIIQSFGTRIRSIRQENQGVSASRNRGMEIAEGNYFAFLDHDDLWEQSKLHIQMEALEKADSDPLVFCHMQQFFCPTLNETERSRIALDVHVLPGYIPGGLLVSRQRFFQIGAFSESRDLGEFIEWYARAKSLHVPEVLVNEIGLHRRIHKKNMGRQHNLYPRTGYLKTLKLYLDRKKHL